MSVFEWKESFRDKIPWDKPQCFRSPLFSLQFTVVSAGLRKLTIHMPSKEESHSWPVLCCSPKGRLPLPEVSAGVRKTDRIYGFIFIVLTRVGLWLFGLYLNSYCCCPLTQGLAGVSTAPTQWSTFQPFPIGSPLSLLGAPSAKLLSQRLS